MKLLTELHDDVKGSLWGTEEKHLQSSPTPPSIAIKPCKLIMCQIDNLDTGSEVCHVDLVTISYSDFDAHPHDVT